MKIVDIAIIGGGASGLAAAITAKRTNQNASVVVIERLPRTGKKILATGNGRCNLTNSDLSSEHYHGSCKKLLDAAAGFSVTDFFERLGVICDDDGYGRIYPRCRSAASVLDALRLECAGLGVEEICGSEVTDITAENGFILRTDSSQTAAKAVILAGGGTSQSALGSNGSVFDLCKRLGISVLSPYPALVPLKTETKLLKSLKGQRAEAIVSFCSDGKCIGNERGEVQFTDSFLSGICVFNLSYLYEQYKTRCELRLDLLPDMSAPEISSLLKSIRSIRSGAAPEDYLSGVFTRLMGVYVLKRALGGNCPQAVGSIDDRQLADIAKTIKSLAFPVTGTAGFERSQVTGGGISADELTNGFAVKRIKGLYACGEVLDVFGDCGGYNLDFAFSSGALAGKTAANSVAGLLNK